MSTYSFCDLRIIVFFKIVDLRYAIANFTEETGTRFYDENIIAMGLILGCNFINQ